MGYYCSFSLCAAVLALLLRRSFHGLQHVFGILTTYNEWRICWLPDCDDAAQATAVQPLIAQPVHRTNMEVVVRSVEEEGKEKVKGLIRTAAFGLK